VSGLPILSASRLKDARACQRLHHYRYGLGYRPAEDATTLRFGTLIHAGLEAWWRATDGALEAALDAMAGEADPFERAKAEALLVGYDARWGDERSRYEVVSVETEFRAPLVNPETGRPSQTWQLGGKIDALAHEVGTGRRCVVEHKTASEDIGVGTDYWRRLRMDGQVSTYYAGAAALGFPADFCLYDVLKKPAQRPNAIPVLDEDGVKIVVDQTGQRVSTKDGKKWRQTADSAEGFILQTRPETPEEFRARLLEVIAADPNGFYSRGEVVRLDGEVAEAVFDIWQIGQQLREADRLHRYPRNPGACLQYGRTCAFIGVCSGEASLDDPSLFKKLDTPHPELADQAGAAA
jgi:hypothetical protein